MNAKSSWEYDEFKPVGRDYGAQSEVDIYDVSHADFRDIVAESHAVLDELRVGEGTVLVDFGCGTGTFVVEAARRGARVHAVDVSVAMLECARRKALAADVPGIEFHHAGFLTHWVVEPGADVLTTTFSFHHLPDFWKGIALKRMHGMLRPGGRLYMHDVILQEDDPIKNIQSFVQAQERKGGAFLREDAEGHFRDEYSTYEWVMDGLFARAGFRIESKHFEGGVLGTYICTRGELTT